MQNETISSVPTFRTINMNIDLKFTRTELAKHVSLEKAHIPNVHNAKLLSETPVQIVCPVPMRRRVRVQYHIVWRICLLARQNMAIQSCRGLLFINAPKAEN